MFISSRVRLPPELLAESSVRRLGHAHSRLRTHAAERHERGAAADAGERGEGGGLRLPDAQSHFALTEGEGWSREERRTDPGVSGESITGPGEGRRRRLKSMIVICRRPRHRHTGFRPAADGVTELAPPGRSLPSDVAGMGAACSRF